MNPLAEFMTSRATRVATIDRSKRMFVVWEARLLCHWHTSWPRLGAKRTQLWVPNIWFAVGRFMDQVGGGRPVMSLVADLSPNSVASLNDLDLPNVSNYAVGQRLKWENYDDNGTTTDTFECPGHHGFWNFVSIRWLWLTSVTFSTHSLFVAFRISWLTCADTYAVCMHTCTHAHIQTSVRLTHVNCCLYRLCLLIFRNISPQNCDQKLDYCSPFDFDFADDIAI